MHSWANKRQLHITSKLKANLITGAAAVLLAGAGLAAILVWTGVIERQPGTPAETRSTPDSSTLDWHEIASWESSGDDDSPHFQIDAETWRVMWVAPHDQVADGAFAVHVYRPDGLFLLNLYDTADSPEIDFKGPLRGTLGLPGPGEYFLRMITARDYQVTIQELR